MAKRRTQFKQAQKADLNSINKIWSIVIQEAPEWLVKAEETLPLPSKHSWSDRARRIILRSARETKLTRKNIASLLDGRLDGGLPITTATVTGLLRRSHEDEGVFLLPRQERENTQLVCVPSMSLGSDFDLSENEIKSGLDFAVRDLSLSITVKPEGPARFYLENLADDECQYATGKRHAGIALHCGGKCNPRASWGKDRRKFEAFCPTHAEKTKSDENDAARTSFLREIPRLMRYA